MRTKRQNSFPTSFALVLSALFLTVLGLLSLIFCVYESDAHFFESNQPQHHRAGDTHTRMPSRRRLVEEDGANSTATMIHADSAETTEPPTQAPTSLHFGASSCGEILRLTSPEMPEIRCLFARTCNDGEGIFLSNAFCNNERFSPMGWCMLLSPVSLLWLLLLFRMLGSTAEDYFAPSLEMFSLKLGLPPRFAGVSLLAVGNGAPDLSASVNAIVADPNKGYRLILGSLSGAGMFIGTVVAGLVIFATNGIVCRGALIRDIVVYMLAVIVVSTQLMKGTINYRTIVLFFSMYFGYVALVFVADMYHRFVCVPQMRKSVEAEALNHMTAETPNGKVNAATYGTSMSTTAIRSSAMNRDDQKGDTASDVSTGPSYQRGEEAPQDIMSKLDDANRRVQKPRISRIGALISSFSDYRPESFRLEEPILLHGRDGVLDKHEHMHSPQHRRRRSSSGGVLSLVGERKPLNEIDEEDRLSEYEDDDAAGEDDIPSVYIDAYEYVDSCPGWCGAFQRTFFELRLYSAEIMYDIFYCKDRTRLDKFLLACELPFTVARKLTVSTPSEGYYCRPVVALSLAISPIWIAFYLSSQMGVSINEHLHYLYISCAASLFAGAMIIRYGGADSLSLWALVPVALYGFVVAATWIDYIGAHLVRLLAFFGAVFKIPNPVMGLTVLAWGNSMGDLSTNVTMARKGLGNMGATACFAGPCFTLLCGLGSGFAALLASDPNLTTIKVTMPPSIKVGFASIILNCLLLVLSGLLVFRRGGKIGPSHAYLMLTIYVSYLATCIALQFTDVVKNSLE